MQLNSRTVRDLIRLPRQVRQAYQQYFQMNGLARKCIYVTVFALDREFRHVFGPEALRAVIWDDWMAAENHFRCPTVFRKDGGTRERLVKLLRDNRTSDGKYAHRAAKDLRDLNQTARAIAASMMMGVNPIADPERETYRDQDIIEVPQERRELYAQIAHNQAASLAIFQHLVLQRNAALRISMKHAWRCGLWAVKAARRIGQIRAAEQE
ncbi:hypothetical protein BDW74DRAFT_10010 [Aspergillus multicolor]|uniref:uncharacterized protein n=1 Tax=Aspergillus multicolor TaxID=41759 RepID=UPI003CCDEE5A